MTTPDGPCAISSTGVRVQAFDDGSLAILQTATKAAMHFTPDQAKALRDFVRLFDRRHEPKTVLTEANAIIHGERRDDYGPAEESLDRIAAMWSAIFGKPVTRADVCLAMIVMKVAREVNRHKRDNLVDVCGYAALLSKVVDK